MKKFNYPSPYIGKWKNLSGILGATPESVGNDDVEVAQRLSAYMNSPLVTDRLKPELNTKDSALNRHVAVDNDLANSYLKDYVDGDEARYRNKEQMSEVLKSLLPSEIRKDIVLNKNTNEVYPRAYRDANLPNRAIVDIPDYIDADTKLSDNIMNAYGAVAHELDHAKTFVKHPELNVRDLTPEKHGVAPVKNDNYYKAKMRTQSDTHFHPTEEAKPLILEALGSIAREAEAREQFKNIRAALRK